MREKEVHFSNEYYNELWREKLICNGVSDIEIRLGMQVLVLNRFGMSIGDEKATKAFSDMYDSDYYYENNGVKTYTEFLIRNKKLDRAIDFVLNVFNNYLGTLEKT